MGAIGVATDHASPERSPATLSRGGTSPLPVDFRSTLAKVEPERFVPGGHAGERFDASVYVTPSAKESVFDPQGGIEPGTVLIMEETPRGERSGGLILMMEKRPSGFDEARGDWRYVVVDGESISDGPFETCAGCHGEALHDHVFPLD